MDNLEVKDSDKPNKKASLLRFEKPSNQIKKLEYQNNNIVYPLLLIRCSLENFFQYLHRNLGRMSIICII